MSSEPNSPEPSASPWAWPSSARGRLLGVLAVIAAAHLPLLGFGLVYDDSWTLRSNGFLRPGHFEPALLFSAEALARHIPDAFRPTSVFVDMLSLRLFGLAAWAHHALSVALHVGVCALLARLLRRLGAPETLSLGATACFGLLGIHAEAVAVISYREDLLAALLGMAAMLAGLRVAEARGLARAGWAAAAVLGMALACAAKLSAAPLVAVFGLLAWAQPWPCPALKRRAGVAVALVALGLGVAAAVAQTAAVHGGLSPYGVENPRVLAARIGLGPVLAASTQIHVGYLGQIFLPLGLSPEYSDRGAAWTDPETVLAAGLLALIFVAAAWACARRDRGAPGRLGLACAALAWMLLCVPTSNLVGLPNMRADRFMYLASAPLCVALAGICLHLGQRWSAKMAVEISGAGGAEPDGKAETLGVAALGPWLPLLLFVLVQGSLGLAATRTYVSNTTLWRVALRRAPDSARAHALMGLQRLATGRQADGLAPGVEEVAARDCARARELDPRYELPWICLAELAVAREDWGAAFEAHQRAVSVSVDRNDRSIAAMAQLALDLPGEWLQVHPELGEDRRALAGSLLSRGLRAYPYSPELHAAAARVHQRIGEPEQALVLVRRARSLRPDRWETIAQGVELALDLGDAAAAHQTWWVEHEVLERADPTTRARLARRLARARQSPDFSLLHSLLSPGVFPDDP
ncbi:hypothetical protein G6O69_19385 [Pseudenhygromyxa sp. WMMC2535]|uniref:tetratricopeptide repeat protein n=1 Tax=Pseudenhygromyxa sp. WMMC2535 TaxID=2712867 RepID=UPI001553E385|nr:hypothetical protein [Pseudenhygromyxa sp. WMMC2535]NVB40017.1 hypothetical protein [Pseudenhygromyxa sp. WMMC2535]